jgi:hypothetical protein
MCDGVGKSANISRADCDAYMQQQRQVCMFLSQDQVQRIHAAFAVLATRGVSVLGSSGDGTHAEPSFLVWGITLDDIVGMAAAYEQEAVFELTNDIVSVIGVFGDERTDRPRRGPLPT